MNPTPIGSRIRIIGNCNHHHYNLGAIYRVHEIDNDGTFKAVDPNGQVGDYLKWVDCEPVGLGWDWLRTQLDARSLDLLSAFSGVEYLSLKPEIEKQLVLGIPHLDEAILGTLSTIEDEISHYVALNAKNEEDNEGIDNELEELFGTP